MNYGFSYIINVTYPMVWVSFFFLGHAQIMHIKTRWWILNEDTERKDFLKDDGSQPSSPFPFFFSLLPPTIHPRAIPTALRHNLRLSRQWRPSTSLCFFSNTNIIIINYNILREGFGDNTRYLRYDFHGDV